MNKTLVVLIVSFLVISTAFGQELTPFSKDKGFIKNMGQIANEQFIPLDSIDFKIETAGVNAYFSPSGIIYHFYREFDKDPGSFTTEERASYNRGDFAEIGKKVEFFRFDFQLLNANPNAEVETSDLVQTYTNYYLPHCPEGILNVPGYEKIVYKDVYPNIDLAYISENGQLKYEFIVNPGGNVKDIQFTYKGSTDLILENGDLNVSNDFGPFKDNAPFTYYELDRSKIESEFVVENGIVSFNLEEYDENKKLVIDPTVTWSTYFDNGGNSDFHCNGAYDSAENFYLAYSSYSDFWPTVNAGSGQYYDAVADGITDLVILRFNANYTMQWATYYGGDEGDYLCGTGGDYGKTLDVDDNDGIYLGGYANGNPSSFPTQNSGVGGAWYQDDSNLKGGDNAFIIKFNQNGVRQWGTLYQHTNVSTSGAGIRINGIVCNDTRVYFTGQTYQFSGFDIPLVSLAGAYNNSTFIGTQDVFLGRFNSDCVLEWSTYFNSGAGSGGFRQGSDISFDDSGNMVFGGQVSGTASTAYLLNPGGGAYFSNTVSGNIDHLIARFNTSLQPTWSTIIGGTDLDRLSEISTDPSGNILVASRMARANIPTANPGGGAFFINSLQSTTDGFIMKFTSAGVYTWGTYVGANNGESSITGIASDNSGNVYTIGYTAANNFPTQALGGAYNDATNGGSNDVIMMRFTNASVNEWSTYYGGASNDQCYGRKIEPATIASVCGYKQFFSPISAGNDFPTTDPGGGAFYEGSLVGSSSNMIVLIEEAGGSTGTAPTSISGTTTICSGNSTTLTQVGGALGTGDNYEWYSGSCGGTAVGSGPSVNVSPTVTTDYFVRVEGPCGTTTCATVTVTVNTNSNPATGINASANPICPGDNTTLTLTGGSLGTGANWEWYTGSCGGTSAGNGTSIVVNPSVATTYYVRAEGTCNNTTCETITINMNTLSTDPTSASASPATICDGQSSTISVSGGSLGTGADWEWYTGSCGGTSVGNGASISVSPTTTTTYYVRAEGTCNNSNCTTVDVTVNPIPTPSITSSNADLCDGETLNLTGTPAGGIFSVTSGPGSIAADVLTATGPGTVNIEYSVTTAGCTGTDTQSITVNPSADASWTSPGTVCESGGIIDLSTLITGTTGGNWTGTGVTGSNFDPSGLNGQVITIQYDVGTTCPDTLSQDISVETAVTATWILPSALCESDAAIDLDLLVTGSSGGSWTGTGVSGNMFDPAGLVGMNSITYSVGGGTCSDMLTQDIEVLNSPTAPSISADADTVCAGQAVILTGNGSDPGMQYNLYDAATGGNLIDSGFDSLVTTVNPTTTTTYYLEVVDTSTSCGNMGGTIPITVVVNPGPSLAVSADENICAGETATLTATGSGTLLWSTSETSASIDVSPTATTTYTVTLTDGNGCTAMDNIVVNVQSSSTVNAVDDGNSTDVNVLVNTNVSTNDTGDPLTVAIVTNATNGVATVLANGSIDYLPFSGFTGTDSIVYSICDVFCSSICDTAVLRITITEDVGLSIPGGFSPNGDGTNETFIIDGLDAYPTNSLTIFNRWGDIVFTASPYMNDWSGQAMGKRTISGDVVTTGTYFYILELDANTEPLHGSIEIKK